MESTDWTMIYRETGGILGVVIACTEAESRLSVVVIEKQSDKVSGE